MKSVVDGSLTYDDVTKLYGVSRATVWRWVKVGWLKQVKVGGQVYFTEKDLKAFERRGAKCPKNK